MPIASLPKSWIPDFHPNGSQKWVPQFTTILEKWWYHGDFDGCSVPFKSFKIFHHVFTHFPHIFPYLPTFLHPNSGDPSSKSPRGIIPVATSQENLRPQTNISDSRSGTSARPLFSTKSCTARLVTVKDSWIVERYENQTWLGNCRTQWRVWWESRIYKSSITEDLSKIDWDGLDRTCWENRQEYIDLWNQLCKISLQIPSTNSGKITASQTKTNSQTESSLVFGADFWVWKRLHFSSNHPDIKEDSSTLVSEVGICGYCSLQYLIISDISDDYLHHRWQMLARKPVPCSSPVL